MRFAHDRERCEIMGEGRRRLLVIEDDPETAEQLVDFLSTSGYQVDLAADGNEGLRRGRSADYAVMTIDRMLPDIDGLDVIRRFREDGIRSEEHTSELQSLRHLVCRLLLEKKNKR